MRERTAGILLILSIFAVNGFAKPSPGHIVKTDIITISVENQYEAVAPNSSSALAVHFALEKDWHFYASAETAPGGMNLKVMPASPDYIKFSVPVFPQSQLYFDKSLGVKLAVFSDEFTVFLPFTVSGDAPDAEAPVTIKVEGAVCSGMQCRMPDFDDLDIAVNIVPNAAMTEPKFALPEVSSAAPTAENQWASYSVWLALGLAFLSGLVLNIMPCVLPVIPLKVMSIFEQARESKGRCIALGLSFCLGILLFFAVLAVLNIVLRLGYGTVFQWGDHFRNPAFIMAMSLLMVVLSLFCFGVFTVNVPSAVAGRAGSGKGYSGSVAMGFLAALLSTPCSFAILTAAFAWAQTQKLAMASIAIMMIGLGMATPYALLTSMPSLLKHLPKPGRWMELFKQTMGFVLLIVSVWLLSVLPAVRRQGILYFGVILAFCVWMWGGWVDLTTPKSRKLIIRAIALVIAVASGMWLLPEPKSEGIDWHEYDAALIETAGKQRPVLVEFMADWCLTCKAVEKTVYARKDITELVERKNVLAIKANTTLSDSPATIALKEVYNEPGVPVSMLFVPGRTAPERLHGLIIGDKLKQLLERLPDKN